MEYLSKYFPTLSARQQEQFNMLVQGVAEWNDKINLVSRKDIDNLELHHVQHSLAIARFTALAAGSSILDLGTGGGFPGLPLAILFPEVEFTLIDARAKKIMVVNELIPALGLRNARAIHIRAEDLKGQFDFVVTRAVATLDVLYKWSRPLIHGRQRNGIPNGLIALKGGEVNKEVRSLPRGTYTEVEPVARYFPESYFEGKYVVYVQK